MTELKFFFVDLSIWSRPRMDVGNKQNYFPQLLQNEGFNYFWSCAHDLRCCHVGRQFQSLPKQSFNSSRVHATNAFPCFAFRIHGLHDVLEVGCVPTEGCSSLFSWLRSFSFDLFHQYDAFWIKHSFGRLRGVYVSLSKLNSTYFRHCRTSLHSLDVAWKAIVYDLLWT